MPPTLYHQRDYSFGQQILSLRTASNLTQTGLAELLGISRQAVVGWESGASCPSPRHLKHLIEIGLQHNAFHSGQEAEEIRALWTNSGVRVPLDETWLADLLAPPSDSAAATAPRSRAPTGDAEILKPGRLVDWGEAPEVANFYGRESELALLNDWLVKEHCRVLSILGIGGIGKSALAVMLMHRVVDEFDAVIWRSLRDAPPPESLRNELVRLLAPEPLTIPLDAPEQQLNLLFEFLRTRRVLIVLDNVESVMEGTEGSGRMQQGFEGYARFLRRAAETKHRSSILLTSREKPKVLAPLEGGHTPVRALHLGQLDVAACEALLQEQEVTGSAAERERLIERYGGNPLALKIVAPTIADLFDGAIESFLEQGETIFGSVRYLLQEQFERLSALEKSIMLWLAVMREPVAVPELAAVLVNALPRAQMLEAFDSLRGRSLIERGKLRGSFTLQSVVLEYTTTYLIEAAVSELESGQLQLLIEHALELANAKEYIREAQVRLIVSPIVARLKSIYRESAPMENHLLALLDPLRARSDEYQGYAPANLMMLLRALRGDLSGLDLHLLSIRNADLRGVNLHDTSLAEATLRDTVFTEAFDTIWTMAFGKNGKYWAGCDRQGRAQLWLSLKRRLELTWRAHQSVITAATFSPNEQRLATSSWDGVIKIWDVSNAALLWTSPAVDVVMALAFSPDGRALASGGTDGKVRIWNVTDGALLQTLNDHVGPVFCVAWSPDGKILASAGHDGQIRLWEKVHDNAELLKPTPRKRLEAHTGPVRGLAYSPDGRTLASASWDRTVKLWDVPSRKQKESIPLQAHIEGLAWSPDGRYLASGELDRAFWVWDVEQHKQRTTFYGAMAPVRALAFSPDSSTLDTAGENGSMQVWDMSTGQCIRNWQGFARTVHEIAWSPDGAHIASGGNDLLVTIWDVAKRAPLYLLRGHKAIIWGVSWSPDGRWLASCGEGSTIRIWDAVKGASERVLTHPGLMDAHHFALAWSPDSERLAVATHRYGPLVYDMRTQTFHRVGHADAPPRTRRVQWSPDGTYLASAREAGLILIWNANDYSLCATLEGHRGMVVSLAWSPDGKRLASGSWGHGSDHLFIWDSQSWTRLEVIDDPNELVFSVAWSADGERLVSAGTDGILRWWNPQNGHCLLSRQGHEGPVQSLRVSPDGRLLASCGDDGAIQVWQPDSGEHVATLRRDRPYERLDITGIKGLSDAQILTLKMMGAIEQHKQAAQYAPQSAG
jgi:WD40 repeat protein/transcriptional regulator with XRE-family HTH domain